MTRVARSLAAVVALATALTMAACTSGNPAGGSATESHSSFTMALSSGLRGFDPYTCVGSKRDVFQAMYDTLMRITPEGKYAPSLAESWHYTNPNTFSMKLRDGVTFPDGTPLDAGVVKVNLERAASSPTAVTAQFAASKPTITVNSKLDLTVQTAEANPDLPQLFSYCGGMIVHPAFVADPSKLANAPSGSGPYTYDTTASITNSKYVLTKREGYWNSAAYPFAKLTAQVIPDFNASFNALQSGQVDVIAGTEQTAAQAESAGLKSLSGNINYFSILLNDRAGTLVPALGDVRVRQALNYAVDRKAVVKTFFGDTGKPTAQILRPEEPGYDKSLDDRYAYDPGKAKQLLAEAGYANGFSMTVLTTPINQFDAVLASVAEYWSKVGVKVQQQVLPSNQWLVEMTTTKYPATIYPLTGTPPYSALNNYFGPGAGFNPFRSKDPAIDEPLSQAAAQLTTGGDDAAKSLQAAQTQLLNQAWYVGLGYDSVYIFYNPKKISGLKMLPNDAWPLFYDWKPAS